MSVVVQHKEKTKREVFILVFAHFFGFAVVGLGLLILYNVHLITFWVLAIGYKVVQYVTFNKISVVVWMEIGKIILILIKIILLLISIAYFTIAERKVMAAIQRRKGPNVVGFWGLLQPLADGLKLLVKEMLIPTKANPIIFILAPIVILTLSLVG